jgi:Tfp pilus assembly protein PilO
VNGAGQKNLIIAVACAAGVLVILAGGYLMLISPKRAKVAELQRQATDTQTKLTLALATAKHPGGAAGANAPDLFRLYKAMPDNQDTAGAILDIAAAARATGVTIDGIAPTDPAPSLTGGSYQSASIQATLIGKYGQFANFLARLQRLVVVRNGQVSAAHGRLFGIDSVQFAAGAAGFPQLKATIRLETYIYSPAGSTTPTTTTPAPQSDLSAAGASG